MGSVATKPSIERQPVLLKHESKSGIMYRSRADEAAAAKPTKQLQRAPRLLLQSAANEPSSERQPVLLKHESKSGIVYRSRADEAAAASITPRTAINCERAKR